MSKDNTKHLAVSFEDMHVSPTIGSPLHQEHIGATGGDATSATAMSNPETKRYSRMLTNAKMPDSKITFQVEVLFKGNWTKKSVRILPSSSLHVFLDKLNKNKYLPTTSMLGGSPLRSDQLSISFGDDKNDLIEADRRRWSEPVWSLGLRDKDFMIIKVAELKELKAKEDARISQLIELPSIPEASSNKSGPAPEHEEKKKSILGSIGRRTSKRSSSSLNVLGGKPEEAEIPSNCGLLFGVPLSSIANKGKPLFESYGVPAFFGSILEIIKRKHTHTEGIFRLSGSLSANKELKKKVDLGQAPPFEEDTDVHCMTSLLKQYLRELPEPLLTYTTFYAWKEAINCDLAEKRMELIKALLLALPKANYCLLKRLIDFLAHMVQYESTTKMGIVNMSTLLGPNLIWAPTRDQGGANDISTPTQVTFFLITNAKALFPDPDERATILLAIGKAKYDFVPEVDDGIPVKAGETVFVTGNDEGHGWIEVTTASNVRHGMFPASFFEPLATFPGFISDAVLSISPPGSPMLFMDEDGRGLIILRETMQKEIDELRSVVEEEVARRVSYEEQIATMQDNFNTLLQVVIRMKDKQKEISANLFKKFDDPNFKDSLSDNEEAAEEEKKASQEKEAGESESDGYYDGSALQ